MRLLIALLIITGLLFSHKSFSQDKESLLKKFVIGISFEPIYCYRQLSYSSEIKFLETLRNNRELPKFGFSTGLNLRYKLNSKFSLESGLSFANRGLLTSTENLTWDNPQPDYPVKSKTRFSYYYIEIPLKANYHFKFGKLNGYTFSGISFNNSIFRRTTLVAQNENGEKSKTTSNTDYGYNADTNSLLIGIGVDIPISVRFLLNIEPIYRQNFTSMSYDKNAKEYFYSFGLNTKLFYRLKKKTK